MKKLLILAYDFPPYISVGGLRPYAWFKYLKEFEIEPIVITRNWDSCEGNSLDYIAASKEEGVLYEKTSRGLIIKTPYSPNLANQLLIKYGDVKFKLLRKIITGITEFCQYFLPLGPKRPIYDAAVAYLSQNPVDAIIATGDPFILFHYSQKLSKKFNTPWIADYRDQWSQVNKDGKYTTLNFLQKLTENRVIKCTSLITTVSPFIAKQIPNQTADSKPISIIENGFDPENIDSNISTNHYSNKLIISYAGTIYPWNPINSFLQYIEHIVDAENDLNIELNFYGINIENELKTSLANRFISINHIVNIFPKIPNKQLMRELKRSHLLLLFNYYSYMGTKIYDYLALQKPILLCFTEDEESLQLKQKHYTISEDGNTELNLQADLLRNLNAGISVKNKSHLKDVLKKFDEELKSSGKITCNSKNIEQYSRKYQVEKLAHLIHKVVDEYKK